jgi:hypothetical protein
VSTWKALERQIAKRLGGQRVPVTGRTGEEGMLSPDIEHPLWSIEVKHRDQQSVPKWLAHAFDQAEASRQPDHLAAVTILHTNGRRLDRAMVILSLADFEALQEKLSGIPN